MPVDLRDDYSMDRVLQHQHNVPDSGAVSETTWLCSLLQAWDDIVQSFTKRLLKGHIHLRRKYPSIIHPGTLSDRRLVPNLHHHQDKEVTSTLQLSLTDANIKGCPFNVCVLFFFQRLFTVHPARRYLTIKLWMLMHFLFVCACMNVDVRAARRTHSLRGSVSCVPCWRGSAGCVQS